MTSYNLIVTTNYGTTCNVVFLITYNILHYIFIHNNKLIIIHDNVNNKIYIMYYIIHIISGQDTKAVEGR